MLEIYSENVATARTRGDRPKVEGREGKRIDLAAGWNQASGDLARRGRLAVEDPRPARQGDRIDAAITACEHDHRRPEDQAQRGGRGLDDLLASTRRASARNASSRAASSCRRATAATALTIAAINSSRPAAQMSDGLEI
jgi:hypothetical protein